MVRCSICRRAAQHMSHCYLVITPLYLLGALHRRAAACGHFVTCLSPLSYLARCAASTRCRSERPTRCSRYATQRAPTPDEQAGSQAGPLLTRVSLAPDRPSGQARSIRRSVAACYLVITPPRRALLHGRGLPVLPSYHPSQPPLLPSYHPSQAPLLPSYHPSQACPSSRTRPSRVT